MIAGISCGGPRLWQVARLCESVFVSWGDFVLIDQRDAATEQRRHVFVLQKHKLAFLHFHTPLAFGNNMRTGQFRLPIFVQILMLPIKVRPVDDGAVRA